MGLIRTAEFTWPSNAKGTSGICQYSRQAVLRMVEGGDPSLWRYYAIKGPDGELVSWMEPGTEYTLIMLYPDDVQFKWPADEESADPTDPAVIQRAMELAKIDFLEIDPSEYFVAQKPCGRPLAEITEDGMLHPGRTYYLRTCED